MGNAILARRREAANRARAELAERPSARNEFNETIDVTWGEGTRTGLRYSHLHWIRLYSPQKMSIHFATHQVVVKGENLDALYELVLSQRVRTLKSTDVYEEAARPKDASTWKVKELYVLQRSGNSTELEPEGERAAIPSPVTPSVTADTGPASSPVSAERVQEEGGQGKPPGDDVSDLRAL